MMGAIVKGNFYDCKKSSGGMAPPTKCRLVLQVKRVNCAKSFSPQTVFVYAVKNSSPASARRKTIACPDARQGRRPCSKPLSQKSKIRLFRDGQFIGTRDRSTIEALYARSLVTLEYNAKGFVVAAHERPIAQHDAEPKPNTPSQGSVLRPMRYSFEDALIECRPWDLRRLTGKRSGIHYAPESLRPLFLRVVLECLA